MPQTLPGSRHEIVSFLRDNAPATFAEIQVRVQTACRDRELHIPSHEEVELLLKGLMDEGRVVGYSVRGLLTFRLAVPAARRRSPRFAVRWFGGYGHWTSRDGHWCIARLQYRRPARYLVIETSDRYLPHPDFATIAAAKAFVDDQEAGRLGGSNFNQISTPDGV